MTDTAQHTAGPLHKDSSITLLARVIRGTPVHSKIPDGLDGPQAEILEFMADAPSMDTVSLGVFFLSPIRNAEDSVVAFAPFNADHDKPYAEHDSRLLAAAYNSYDLHCGARAVECAEADLLGEALRALERMIHRFELYDSKLAASDEVLFARAVLAKAKGNQ